jgi:hypothetical protein
VGLVRGPLGLAPRLLAQAAASVRVRTLPAITLLSRILETTECLNWGDGEIISTA